MASAITHAAVGAAAVLAFAPKGAPPQIWPAAVLCAAAPDLDVISFFFNFRFGHLLGHRGFFHSLPFGLLVSALIVALFFRGVDLFSWSGLKYLLFFLGVWASHGFLDAMTSGGYGAALLAPFYNKRIALPWMPIPISPVGPRTFFSKWGMEVLRTEIYWVWLPVFSFASLTRFLRVVPFA